MFFYTEIIEIVEQVTEQRLSAENGDSIVTEEGIEIILEPSQQ